MRLRLLTTPYRCVPILLFACTLCPAQLVPDDFIHDVDVCELLREPTSYDTKVVRFRGRLNFEFEGNNVDDKRCTPPLLHTRIWWVYGREGVWGSRQEDDRIRAISAPMLRDEWFAEFEARAHASRKKRPDGEPCYSHLQCTYYDVAATFTGRFFAGGTLHRRAAAGGYGHKSCCHMFVMEQVAGVEATRTHVPSENTAFSCSTEAWQNADTRKPTGSLETHLAANQQFLAEQMTSHGDESLVEAMNDSLSPYSDFTGTLSWSSPDLLTTYRIRFPRTPPSKRKHKREDVSPPIPSAADITRETCHQVGP